MKKDFHVDVYNVEGPVDYSKLIKEFGVTPLKEIPSEFEDSLLFRRGLIFAHRDFGKIIGAVKNKEKYVMMTGLMPTGKMHIGHMIVAQQMIMHQKKGAKVYIAVADIEAYNARGQSLEESRKNAIEQYIKNYIALGLKPERCEIYFQSERCDESKKANAYYRLQNLLSRHITFNEFKAVYGSSDPGKMLAALLQASDMLHPGLKEFDGGKKEIPIVIPVGIDQDPHLRLAREVARKYKGEKLSKISSTYHGFVPGLDGGKMSSSKENSYIALTDSEEDVSKKIKKYAFSGGQDTLEEHRKKGGNPDVDISFQYLRYFFEPSDSKLEEIYKAYKSGEMLTGELKDYTIKKINEFLKEHQKKMKKITDKEIEKYLA